MCCCFPRNPRTTSPNQSQTEQETCCMMVKKIQNQKHSLLSITHSQKYNHANVKLGIEQCHGPRTNPMHLITHLDKRERTIHRPINIVKPGLDPLLLGTEPRNCPTPSPKHLADNHGRLLVDKMSGNVQTGWHCWNTETTTHKTQLQPIKSLRMKKNMLQMKKNLWCVSWYTPSFVHPLVALPPRQ